MRKRKFASSVDAPTSACDALRPMKLEFHRGRLIDHIQLRARDFEASKRFYRAVLAALGKHVDREPPGFFFADELCITPADPNGPISRIHLAFQAQGAEEVMRFHRAALEAGGRDNGVPSERRYHVGYYAAYVLDPDGNNIEAVYH